MKKLAAAGLKINDVPEATKAEFRKIAQKVYPSAIKGFGPKGQELVDMLIFFNK
ncbi:MAG: hypothetical protein JRJ04_13975 [Deltaproteobacteria bacterium]|nr:hypothetical protein [Deltaproteobacteria bacterium]